MIGRDANRRSAAHERQGASVETASTAERRLRLLAMSCGLVIAAIGTTVTTGWLLDVQPLMELVPGYVPMKFNTAWCFVALGVAIALSAHSSSPRPAALIGVVPLLVGAASLGEYVTGSDWGIDQLVVDDPDASVIANPPGRMAVVTAVAFVCLGLSVVLTRSRRMSQWLLVPPLAVAVVTLLGYLYGAEGLYAVVARTTISMPTAVLIVLVVLGAGASIPHGALGWALTDPGAGGVLLRTLLPVGIVGIPVIGYLRLLGQEAGWYDTSYGLALMASASGTALLGAAWWAAKRIAVIDTQRMRVAGDLEELNASLVEGRDRAWQRADSLAEELSAERARFARAVSKSDDVVWTVEILPDGPLRLEYVTGDGMGIFGGALPPGGDIATTMAGLVHPEDRGLNDEFNRQVAAGLGAQAELRLVGLDGLTRWVWVRGGPRREGGRLFYDGMTTNITQQHSVREQAARLLELEREQVERLTELTQMRDQFIATAGHDLRTPLAVITGYAALLADDPNLTPEQQEQAARIDRRATQLHDFVGEMFDLAKVQGHMVTLDRRLLDVAHVVEDVVDGHRIVADAHNVRLESDVGGEGDGAADLTVSGDEMRVRQVLDNLISNAIKYTPAGGSVRVECTARDDRDDLSSQAPTCAGVTVRVSDTGIGIAPEQLPHVFDPLFRASSALDARIDGTGLGLAISKALVGAHGGTIDVTSKLGEGSTFTMYLPA